LIKTDIENRMRDFLNRRASHAFKKWSAHCLYLSQSEELKLKMKKEMMA